jgi:hypothetical protein
MSTFSRGVIVFVTAAVVAVVIYALHIIYLGSPRPNGYLVGGISGVAGVVVWQLTGRKKA